MKDIWKGNQLCVWLSFSISWYEHVCHACLSFAAFGYCCRDSWSRCWYYQRCSFERHSFFPLCGSWARFDCASRTQRPIVCSDLQQSCSHCLFAKEQSKSVAPPSWPTGTLVVLFTLLFAVSHWFICCCCFAFRWRHGQMRVFAASFLLSMGRHDGSPSTKRYSHFLQTRTLLWQCACQQILNVKLCTMWHWLMLSGK